MHLTIECHEFAARFAGMCYALDGGVWLHRHRWNGERMAHVVSSDRERLLVFGRDLGLEPQWLQYKPLKDPRTGERREAWHWDLRSARLAQLDAMLTGGAQSV